MGGGQGSALGLLALKRRRTLRGIPGKRGGVGPARLGSDRGKGLPATRCEGAKAGRVLGARRLPILSCRPHRCAVGLRAARGHWSARGRKSFPDWAGLSRMVLLNREV